MGTVYLGKVTRTRRGLAAGSAVAVKVLHPRFARDHGIRSRFKFEAGLGMALKHPGVVRIHHVGSERLGGDTFYFIVMEYLRGMTLKSVLEESGSLSDDMLRKIAVQVSETLAVIHRRGIIHRDLKPENIFLEKKGVVKIGDFGFSRKIWRTGESIDSGFYGTVAYAAPERFGPARVGTTSDLYSLGVVLYELAVGENPFLGSDLISTISNHIGLTPEPPASLGVLVSPFMSALIMALLEKDPKKRLGPGARLRRILEGGEADPWWRSVRSEIFPEFVDRRRAALHISRKTSFYGREREIAGLEKLIGEARGGKGGRVAVIEGEAGVGKTRLLDRLLERMDMDQQEGDLVMVQGIQSEVRVPYSALISAVLAALDLKEPDRDLLQSRLREKLADLFLDRPQTADAFADFLVATSSGPKAGVPSPETAAQLFKEFFTLLSKKKLLILVVENIQGMGKPARDVLLEIARHIGGMRVMMILTARSGEPLSGEESDLVGFLEELDREKGTRFFRLSRLDEKDVKGMLEELGFPAPVVKDRVGSRVFGVTEGNPYFVLEVARLLLDKGVLNDENPDWLELLRYVPATIQDVFYRRLFRLAVEERRFLEQASVFGVRFRVEDVVGALGMDLADAVGIVSKLESRSSLIRPTVGKRHRFDHVLIREMILDSLGDEERRACHERAGLYFEKMSTTRSLTGREILKTAVHFSRAGNHAGALRYFFQAQDYLLFRNAHESALALAKNAVNHVAVLREAGQDFDRGLECRINLREARIAAYLGKRDVEFRALRRAFAAAGNQRLRSLVSLRMGQHYYAVSRFVSALHCVEAALNGMRRARDMTGEADAHQTLAGILADIGENADSVKHLEEARELRRNLGDRIGQARILTSMGLIHLERGERSLAREAFRESLSIFRKARNDEGIAEVLIGVGKLHLESGKQDFAEKALRRAAEIAHRLGRFFLRARSLTDLGECLLEKKNFEEAADILDEAFHLAEDGADKRLIARTLATRARLMCRPGAGSRNIERALKESRRAVAETRSASLANREQVYSLNALATVFLEMGKARSALAITRMSIRILGETRRGTKLEKETLRLHGAASGIDPLRPA